MEILGYYSKNLDKRGIQCSKEKDRTGMLCNSQFQQTGWGAAGMGFYTLPVEDQLNSSGVSMKIENFFRDRVKKYGIYRQIGL